MHHSHGHRFEHTPAARAAGRIHRLRHGLGYYLVETYTDMVASKLLRRRSAARRRAFVDL